MLTLAVPLIFSGLIRSVVNYFMILFLAHLGQDILAAGALVTSLFLTFNVIILGTLTSINILVAYLYGGRDHHSISLVFRDGLRLVFLLAPPAIFICWNAASLLSYFGQDPILVAHAKSYLHALAWGIFPNLVFLALMQFILALGKIRLFLLYTALQTSLNVIFSFVLIFGKYGLPYFGIAGAGWGITISFWIAVLLLLSSIFIKEEFREYTVNFLSRISPSYVFELFKIGLPIGIMYAIEYGFLFISILIIGSFNTQQLAANQIALQYVIIQIPILLAIAQSITIRTGHLLGEGNIASATQVVYSGIFISVTPMFLVAIFYWAFPLQLISVDLDIHKQENQQLIHYAIQLLAICALFQILYAIRISLFGALRSFKDTYFTLFISIISLWLIALPIGYLLTIYYKLGGLGMWEGICLGAALNAFLFYWRFEYKVKSYKTL